MTECERGARRKSERLIEHFASIALFSNVLSVRHGSPFDPCTIMSHHSTSSGVTLQSFRSLSAANVNPVYPTVRIRSVVTYCFRSMLATDGFHFIAAVRLHDGFQI
jgi:hypothetical protein